MNCSRAEPVLSQICSRAASLRSIKSARISAPDFGASKIPTAKPAMPPRIAPARKLSPPFAMINLHFFYLSFDEDLIHAGLYRLSHRIVRQNVPEIVRAFDV